MTSADLLTELTGSIAIPGRTVAAVAALLEQAQPGEVVVVWEDRADLLPIDELPRFLDQRSEVVSVVAP